ncbi:unnamed protein product [Owenia fusiformis]|uniref:2-C-methyl-D-erythritol 4-phosphate cytidylyltransferase, chloroplastic n=1 Tax=Owenia fusiformis TaxID=6347 RepID=A0A8J1TRH1_OWEFU|nr:unnamed protein product [Owenia fusiformis]
MDGSRVVVVLPAGGCSMRMNTDTPKQYMTILNRPLLSYTIEAFERISWVEQIIVVTAKEQIEFVNKEILPKYGHSKTCITEGGTTRHHSIYNGVKHIASVFVGKPDIVVVHDAVRPFVDEHLLGELVSEAKRHGASAAIRPLVSTVIAVNKEGFLDESLERSKYRASETPQTFQYDIIKSAYEKCSDYDFEFGTECLHLALQYTGTSAKLVEGSSDLWKVTYKKDFYAAEGILKERSTSVRLLYKNEESIACTVHSALEAAGIKTNKEIISNNDISTMTHNCLVLVHDVNTAMDTIKQLHNTEGQRVTANCGSIIIHVLQIAATSERFSLHRKFQNLMRECSRETRDTCVNGVLFEGSSMEDKMCAIIQNLIRDRNIVFTGQVFLVGEI